MPVRSMMVEGLLVGLALCCLFFLSVYVICPPVPEESAMIVRLGYHRNLVPRSCSVSYCWSREIWVRDKCRTYVTTVLEISGRPPDRPRRPESLPGDLVFGKMKSLVARRKNNRQSSQK